MLLDNKKLALTLAVLTGLFLLVRWMKGDKNVRNFDSTLFVLDTSQVKSIKLYPAVDQQAAILFSREANGWQVSKDNITSPIPANKVSALLRSIRDIKPSRLAARTKDKWKQFQVTDSLGTRVLLENANGETLADVIIGKFSYRQAPQQPGPGGQQGISGLTYVRNSADEETFATEGFLSMTFNRDFNSFRDKRLITSSPDQIKRLTFRTPDGAYTLANPGGTWLLDGTPADSTQVVQYLNQIRNISGSAIDDQYTMKPTPDFQMTISGDNMSDIKISADQLSGEYKITSSLNPTTIFTSDSSGVFGRIYKPVSFFQPANEQ